MKHAQRRSLILPAVLLGVGLAATVGADDRLRPTPTAIDRPAGSLPLLHSSGVHLYVQQAYEGFAPEIADAVTGRYLELVDAGMDCTRHLFDWRDIELARGEYDVDMIIEAMDVQIALGTPRQFVNISVIDSFGPEALPTFIADLLEDGVAWNDDRIIEPFKNMLSEVIPVMLDRGMYMISFANEPSGYYENDPDGAAAFTRFVEQAIRHTWTLSDDLATTIVFAGPNDAAIPHLMPFVDVATFNTYAYEIQIEPSCTISKEPLPLFWSAGRDAVGPLLDDLIDAAGGRLICIQEFGQSTGWNDEPETLGPLAGLETQREVMEALAVGLAERRQHFRTVSLWTLNDHTPAGMQYVADAIEAEGLPPCYADNIAEIFGPTGIVRSDATASTKPAFDAFKNAIRPLRDGRGGPFRP